MASRDLTVDYIQRRKIAKIHRLNSLYTKGISQCKKESIQCVSFDEELAIDNKIQVSLEVRVKILIYEDFNQDFSISSFISRVLILRKK